MLNAEIAIRYDQLGLRYLSGMRCSSKQREALLPPWTDAQFEKNPIVSGETPRYWGRGCTVRFEHNGHTVIHKGLVVLSGPLRDQLRQARRAKLQALEQELMAVGEAIGKPWLRTVKAVQPRLRSRLRESPVGRFMVVHVYETEAGGVTLRWEIDEATLAEAEHLDGRYLLVTNDWHLSHEAMFQLYRAKDGGEKRFLISKNDLVISPVYLHKDQRIASMTLLNMIALLAYSILERQVRLHGLMLTTRQIIQRLQDVTLIEADFRDGSCMRRITSLTPKTPTLLKSVAAALNDLADGVSSGEVPMVLRLMMEGEWRCIPLLLSG